MGRRNRNKLVVPESRQALNQFKNDILQREGLIPKGTEPKEVSYEVAKEVGVPLSKGYNGDLSTKEAGKIGGQIGGRMVRELVKIAQEELAKNNKL